MIEIQTSLVFKQMITKIIFAFQKVVNYIGFWIFTVLKKN